MWFLSLSTFIAAMSVWFRGKNTELPLIGISTSLLFALPNIRNSQPGVPSPVGTTEDSESKIFFFNIDSISFIHMFPVVGFFWNILLVAVRYVKKEPTEKFFFPPSQFDFLARSPCSLNGFYRIRG